VAEATGMTHIDVGALVKEKALHGGRDDEYDCFILDEEKVLSELDHQASRDGGCIIDFHTIDFFPAEWIDLVIVLRTDNELLYERLESRGYSEKKLKENIEAEIMQVVLDEAKEAYDPSIVIELTSDDDKQMEANVASIVQWLAKKRNDSSLNSSGS